MNMVAIDFFCINVLRQMDTYAFVGHPIKHTAALHLHNLNNSIACPLGRDDYKLVNKYSVNSEASSADTTFK